jgi:UDPglucose 6-dehydrogenase
MKKKIAVIGHGYVGQAVEKFFENHFDMVVVDPKYNTYEDDKLHANECDFAVVCVPTPMSDDGSVDLSFIETTFKWLATPLVLIKSTIPPGTTEMLRDKYNMVIGFSPEYIGEGNYFVPFWKDYPDPHDMTKHSFQIVGARFQEEARAILEYFQRVSGPEARYMTTDSTTAELCKYMENSYIGTKVTFVNEFKKMADAFGVDFGELRELWLLDGRVGRMYTSVFADAPGFGGKCLPKDINGIVKATEKVGYVPKLLKSVLAVNKEIRNETA